MLVLSRRNGQAIYIQAGGRTIRLAVGDIKSGRARLYVEAPVDVFVVREELLVKLAEEKEAADARAVSNSEPTVPVGDESGGG